jgi:hypothetical protein
MGVFKLPRAFSLRMDDKKNELLAHPYALEF